MPKILASRYALPPHATAQERIRSAVAQLFAGKMADLPKLLAVFDNSRIDTRHLIMPLDWYRQSVSAAERNRIYQQQGGELLLAASRACLAAASLAPDRIDHVIFVSSTGHATPTLDTRLINDLGLPRTTTRLPIWGLGCAAGASGLARAFDHCRAYPGALVLVTALECCSLNFLQGDLSRKNLIATALFSDGAAAVLVAGDAVGGSGPQILATRSYLFADSERIMGWDFCDEGMELILSPRLPALIKGTLAEQVDTFLADHDLQRSDLVHYLFHPGGAKIIEACSEALSLVGEELRLSEEELRRHGNISSVSVLAVLTEWLAGGDQPSGHGLLATFGPGFSSELLLLRS